MAGVVLACSDNLTWPDVAGVGIIFLFLALLVFLIWFKS